MLTRTQNQYNARWIVAYVEALLQGRPHSIPKQLNTTYIRPHITNAPKVRPTPQRELFTYTQGELP